MYMYITNISEFHSLISNTFGWSEFSLAVSSVMTGFSTFSFLSWTPININFMHMYISVFST